MTTIALKVIAPLEAALPDPPTGNYFTETQWVSLMALMDTVIPSVKRESVGANKQYQDEERIPDTSFNTALHHLQRNVTNAPTKMQLDQYLAEKPSDNPEFHELVKRTLIQFSREDARKGFSFLLSALNTRVGCLLFTSSITPFHEQPITTRSQILASWRTSRIPALQAAFKQVTFVAKNLWIKTSPSFYPLVGFPKVPDHYRPGQHFEYQFEQFGCGGYEAVRGGKESESEVFETEILIVGSGCGGGVCAKNLAEAGHQVLVVDKSYYFFPSQLPMSEKDGGVHLYVDGGVVSSDDASMTVIAGSNWGGGGTINWSASLQPQSFVRDEWSKARGLPLFTSQTFQECLDRVCDRMGVSDKHIRHNHGNQVLMEGARRLGMTYKAVPQNTGGNEHFCGHCTLGCGAAEKQGPVVSWLPDAQRAGAKFAEGFTVEKVLFETINGKRTATGAKGTWKSRNKKGGVDGPDTGRTTASVVIKAKRVIISAGTLWSPVILQDSGLTNKHIGRNLYLHPVNIVSAVFPEDVRPWEGGILTSVVNSLENLDTHGHGAKLEATCMMPSWCLTFLNWNNGLDWKLQALKYRHMNSFISIVRDRDTGRVYRDPDTGFPRMDYSPSAFDRAHAMEGVIALAKINFIMGASEVHVCIAGTPPFIRANLGKDETSEETYARFNIWLEDVRKRGNKPPTGIFASAHQMGTCRMSRKASMGVVDMSGKVWDTEGLYVSDASVFPSASGVNPMITNMAISDWISRQLSADIAKENMPALARL
ncbi:hypothetical protein B2J93_3134 [Marssonina coronariae]|uniref:Long-chain-alcohol oxidase n=1 Tax=Diplocarpon coronariae TaxID=2795749 RepID=A0A218Z552_9HELO|nr:hypothetical protein B2J93_3134 [Marssonina coronariae]